MNNNIETLLKKVKDEKFDYIDFKFSDIHGSWRHITIPAEKFSKKNLFIGPYTDKKEIIRILRDLRKIFPYCSCKKPIKKKRRHCLYYHNNIPHAFYSDWPLDRLLQSLHNLNHRHD